MPPLTDWADDVLAAGDDLPDETFDRILALGERARGKLLDLATDPRYRGLGAEGDGFAPLHALEILAELPPDDATAARLVESLAADPESEAADALAEALGRMGGPAARRLADALAAASDAETVVWMSTALAQTGVRDDATLEALLAAFDRRPNEVAWALGEQDDPRALPALARALDAARVGAGMSAEAEEGVVDMASSIEALGGALTDAQRAKLDLVERRRERRARREGSPPPAEQPTDETPVAGPNDPCPCGSGRKFKKCCAELGLSLRAGPRSADE